MTEPSAAARPPPPPGMSKGPPALLLVALLIAIQAVVWTAVPLLAGRSLPLDVVSDGLAWGHEWQWGYYKHPPLPSWEVELFFDTLGDLGVYLLSQITIGVTYLFVYLLGRELMAQKWAAAGTLLTACIYYFSIPTPEFNHNVAQMPLWAAIVYAYFLAVRDNSTRAWSLLGVLAGVALLTKYAAAVLLAVVLIHFLAGPERRVLLRNRGPYLSIVLCGAILAPHIVWLVHHHFPTLSYATRRAGQSAGMVHRLLAPLHFLLTQLLDISPAILVAAIAGFIGRESWKTILPPDRNLRFLLTFTFGPAVLTCALSLLTGMGLRDMWGAPMWDLFGLLLVYATRTRWSQVSWKRLSVCMGAAFVLLPAAYVLSTAIVPAMRGKPSRTQWPDTAMAHAFEDAFRQMTGHPLRIVAADGWLGGLIAARSASRPSVFTDGSLAEAPWITPERLAQQGALVLWQNAGPIPRSLRAIPGFEPRGTKQFAWPGSAWRKPLVIGWGIVPVRSNQE